MPEAKRINAAAGLGSGRFRRPYRIREWLIEKKGMTMAELGREISVDRAVVSATIRGARNDRRVLLWLRDNGCPLKHLSLPEDLKEEL